MVSGLINENPIVYQKQERRARPQSSNTDELSSEAIDQLEIFDHIRDIKDPEHPYSLEELKVLTEDSVEVDDDKSYVRVTFTPTVEHCSMVTIIGLSIRVKLMRSLPDRYKVDIRVAPGTHATEDAVNKQLNDKERVAAALENPNLVEMVDECLLPSFEVTFTPTVEHCSMVVIIGLSIRVKLMRSLPDRYKIDIRVAPGTHATEDAVNIQLNDKERVAAALESPNLAEMVDECLLPSFE